MGGNKNRLVYKIMGKELINKSSVEEMFRECIKLFC